MNEKEPVAALVAQHQQNSNSGNDGVCEGEEGRRREREDGRACVRASERARACEQKQGVEKKEPKRGRKEFPRFL
jgi:hypothetical protein